MDLLFLLAEQANQPLITESFLKWVVGGMSVAIVALATYIKALIGANKKILIDQIKEAPLRRTEIEEGIRNRYQAVIKQKDEEIKKIDDELKTMRLERFHFLQAQIEDGKKQEKGYQDLANDYHAIIEELKPVLENHVEVLQNNTKTLNYCNSAIKAHRKKRESNDK